MRTLWYVFGGIALLRLADNRQGIGKIVDGKPPGVTPCLDGKFSTHIPGRGVCSYHAGWKGTAQKMQVEEVPNTLNTPLPTIEPPKKESVPRWMQKDREIVLATNEKGIYLVDIDYKTAYDAHRGTSFSPDTRAQQEVERHRKEFIDLYDYLTKGRTPDQVREIDARWKGFVDGYTKRKLDYLRGRNGLMSTMITGRGNFPVRRMQKKSNASHKKLDALVSYWKKFIDRIRSTREIYPERLGTEPIKSGDANALEEMTDKLSKLVARQEYMKNINKILRSKKNIPEKLKAAGLSQENITKLLEQAFVGKRLFTFELSNNNQNINTLKKRIEREKKILAARTQGEKEIAFAGGTVSEAHADNRLRIYFDDIPTPEMRTKLKRNGWRWSPKNKAWQRQLTRNAWISAESVLNLRP